jgi:hypothetical protein
MRGIHKNVSDATIGLFMSVPQNLAEAREIYKCRGIEYGEGWRRVGGILMEFFPGGLCLDTPESFGRFATFCTMINKLNRYAESICESGHEDSAMDLICYAAILLEKTERGESAEKPRDDRGSSEMRDNNSL